MVLCHNVLPEGFGGALVFKNAGNGLTEIGSAAFAVVFGNHDAKHGFAGTHGVMLDSAREAVFFAELSFGCAALRARELGRESGVDPKTI